MVTLYSPENVIQSEINLKQVLNPHLEFNRYLLFSLVFYPRPSAMLVLGLGGGVVPRILNHIYPRALVDVVEIDPVMLTAARDYFGFTTSANLRVHIADASGYIHGTGRLYDLIFLDTYCGLDLPKSVDSRIFFKNCAARLSEGGFLAANLIPKDKTFLETRLQWLKQVLGSVYLLRGVTRTNEVAYAGRKKPEKSTLLKNAASLKKILPFNLKAKRLIKRLEYRGN